MKKLLPLLALAFIASPIITLATSDVAVANKTSKHNKGYGSRSRAHFNKIDKNNDGQVSKSEFLAFETQKFNKKDKNKDGNITPEEFSKRLAKKKKNKK